MQGSRTAKTRKRTCLKKEPKNNRRFGGRIVHAASGAGPCERESVSARKGGTQVVVD